MEIDIYFEPISLSGYEFADKAKRRRLGDVVRGHLKKNSFPDLEGINMAIIGVLEDRNATSNPGCAAAPNEVRKYLYQLFEGAYHVKLPDCMEKKKKQVLKLKFFY